MTDIGEILVGDVLVLMETAGEPIVYHRKAAARRDPATREVTDALRAPEHFPAALLGWRQRRAPDGAPVRRTRDVIFSHRGFEPREGDEIEVPREGRTYTVSGEVRGFVVSGATVAWRVSTADGR